MFYYSSMTWEEFQIETTAYEAVWKKMQTQAIGPMAAFLKKSYLVVYCGRQFNISDDILAVIRTCPAFFIDQEAIEEISQIDKELQKLSSSKEEMRMKSLMKELASYSPQQLEISSGWLVEVRFPYVDIDLIQELKQSPYCNQELTMMRPASINVILRKNAPHDKET